MEKVPELKNRETGCFNCKHQVHQIGTGVYSKMCVAPQLEDNIEPGLGWTGGAMLPKAACREVKSLCGAEARWFENRELEINEESTQG